MNILDNYKLRLSIFDWGFERSDDQNVWRKYKKELEDLKTLAEKIDKDFSVWNTYAVGNYKIKEVIWE